MRITFYRSGKLHLLLFASLSFALGVGAQGAPNAPMAVAGAAKSSVPADAKPGDYSAEPYVVEKMSNMIALQNDGTYTAETTIRVRIQSQAGVQGFGIVSAPYASGTSTMDVTYVRVTKPDGQVVVTPSENTLDMPAQITQQAPFYSDIKVKQVAVKGLAIGDTLEYQFRLTNNKPIDPGQFWYDLDFLKTGIVLDEETQFSAPQGRYVKVQSAEVQPSIEQKDGRTVYTWKTEHLKGVAADKDAADPGPHHPSIQITTFHSWDEVGAWVASLLTPQAAPTPEIRAKAQELTANASTEQDKIRALYTFVSTKYHYIGIDFGIGRYQPHAASEVLSNDYGDCKDKHTLLASLLGAVGIKAYPALVNTEEEIDPDVPSPGQFDHVITAIPQGNTYLFLDTTAEVAPYGYLIPGIRDKKALVVPDGEKAALIQTPPDPPFKSYFKFQSDGNLTDSGEYDGKMHMSMRGDGELIFRIALRQFSESQWTQAIQSISSNMGFGGKVSDGSVAELDTPDQPLELNYSYKRDRVGDWDNKQITAPLPPVDLVVAPDKSMKDPKPLKLGSAVDEDFVATVRLPSDTNPQLPQAALLKESFADYESSYSVSSGVLRIERKFSTMAREISPSQFDVYRKFVKAVQEDEDRFIPVYGTVSSLGASSNPEAQESFNQGLTARNEGDMTGAKDDFQKAVGKDPNFAQAWAMLGFVDMQTGDRNQGIAEMKKAANLAPSAPIAKYIARSLLIMRQPDDSLEVWRNIEKKNPQDPDAPSAVGSALITKKQYSDAVIELQTAANLDPHNANIFMSMGLAYIKAGDANNGVASLHKSLELDHSPQLLNDAAYYLADNNLDLDEALHYAKDAVKEVEAQTASITLDKITLKDFQSATLLSHSWDTLGWVEFRLGHNDAALDYLNAAWSLGQDSIVAYHIGQVYEKQGKVHEAVVAYGKALSVMNRDEDAEQRLNALRPKGKFQPGEGVNILEVQNMRTIELRHFYDGSASATFNVLLAPSSKVLDVKFVKGSEAIRDKGEELLKTAHFDVLFPQVSTAFIVRQGVLDCETVAPKCTFVLIPPNAVRMVN